MSDYVLLMSFVITLPVQILICYVIKKDIEEYKEREEAKQRSLDNLLGRNKIDVDLTEEDMFLIENLMIHEDCKTIEQFIRKEINNIKGA